MTTRTTRKAPWAVVLTALLAVLSLAFGVMAVAGVANAYVGTDKPDDPGKSESAPGHEVTPPGHQDDGTPGNSDGTPGGGNGNDTTKKVWICHADVNNNGDAGLADGTGGEFKKGFNVIHISVNAAENAHFKLHPADQGPFTTEAEAYATCLPQPKGGTLCYLPTQTKVDFPDVTVEPYTSAVTSADYTTDLTRCEPARKTGGTLCYLPTLTKVDFPDVTVEPYTSAVTSVDYTTDLTRCITAEEAAAIDAALAEPATVAPVLPGTIEEPEAVAVPAPATVPPLPATIPAGDGSGTPTVSTVLLALLALGATALAISTVRLVRTTR